MSSIIEGWRQGEINERLAEAAKEYARREESFVLEQLNKLVSDGILVVTVGPLTLSRRFDIPGDTIHMSRMISLDVRDRELIESLRARIAELEGIVKMYKEAL